MFQFHFSICPNLIENVDNIKSVKHKKFRELVPLEYSTRLLFCWIIFTPVFLSSFIRSIFTWGLFHLQVLSLAKKRTNDVKRDSTHEISDSILTRRFRKNVCSLPLCVCLPLSVSVCVGDSIPVFERTRNTRPPILLFFFLFPYYY